MTTTRHGELVAESTPHDSLVNLSIADAVDMVIDKDVLIQIAAAHAAKWPEPRLGQSIYRSVDAHLIAQQAVTTRALVEVSRLRNALEHIRSLGNGATTVAGEPLALYATAALNGDLPDER